jgi:hypothetical protein
MRLKVTLGCFLGLLLVLPSMMAADKADDPPAGNRPACLQDPSEETPDCRGKHRHRRAGGGEGRAGGQGDCCGSCAERMGEEGADARFTKDHDLFHFLLDHRSEIRRTVKMRDDGVETVTESSNPKVTEKIREHVLSMYERIEEGRPIHRRDPLFAELFRHTDKIRMTMKSTKKGIRVIETSEDPHVAALIQAHAEVVTLFTENGHAEVHRNHTVPGEARMEDGEGGCPHRGSMAQRERSAP